MARIRPRTEVRSGPSTVSGTGASPILASGAPQASGSGAEGSGTRDLTSSGTPQAQSSVVSGSQSATNQARLDALLSAYTIPFSAQLQYPAEPTTSETVAVSTISELQAAVQVSNRTINCAVSTTFAGDLSNIADDLIINMPNSSTFSGLLSMVGNQRLRWVGGNVVIPPSATLTEKDWHGVRDILFDDVEFDGIVLLNYNGLVSSKRVAFINSTMDATDHAEQYMFYSQQSGDGTDERHQDVIAANCVMRNYSGGLGSYRIGWAERCVVAECAFNPEESTGTGFRYFTGCRDVFVGGKAGKPVIIVGRIHLGDRSESGGSYYVAYAVQDSVWDYVHHYWNTSAWATHSDSIGELENTGVVSNSVQHSDEFNVGATIALSPLTAGDGNSVVQAYTDGVFPDVSAYGAQR